jgi:hypothetical protein
LGNYQGVPRLTGWGQLEEAQARSNQHQKWLDRNSGWPGAEKLVIVRRGDARNPELTVSEIATVKFEPLWA